MLRKETIKLETFIKKFASHKKMEKRQSQIEVEITSTEALLSERSTEFNRMKSQLREVNRKLAESKLENIKLAHENANLRGEHLINKNNNVNTF